MDRTVKYITSFEDLHNMAEGHSDSHFIYRGENDTSYTLRPKYGRSLSSIRKDTDEIEIAMLREFKRRGAPHVENLPRNDWEWLAVAQHFGLATRLLDWTENPLVAAFFATTPLLQLGDRVIYALEWKEMKWANDNSSPFNISDVVIYRPTHIATRIMAQGGVFTAHPRPALSFKRKALEQWIIKEEAVVDICLTLDRYGFNSATMFPGLDGLGLHINDWHLRGTRKLAARKVQKKCL